MPDEALFIAPILQRENSKGFAAARDAEKVTPLLP
jgi:hypothetical protein